MIRFQLVDDHRDIHGVKRVCEVLGIQRSSYYKWRDSRQDRADLQAADDALVPQIADIHRVWDRTYGYRRITVELAADGPVNHKRVARLMRANNMSAFTCANRRSPRSRIRVPRSLLIG